MPSLLRRNPYTSVSLTLALVVLVAALGWDIHVFALPGLSIVGLEQNELGEVMIAFLVVIPAFFVDRLVHRQRIHEAQLQAEQLRVVHVTMRTVQDIVNNNLNQLQLLRLEADGHVDAETLRIFDETIQDTAKQLTELGNLKVFSETLMVTGPGIKAAQAASRAPAA